MNLRRLVGLAVSVVVFGLGTSSARAQSWSDKLFDTRNHDFGYVARGNFKKTFTIKNTLNKPVHIQKLEPSCRICTVAKPEKDSLQPGESTALDVSLDTYNITEPRTVAVTVTFDRPQWGQTRLTLQCKPRTDIVFSPPDVRFGTVKRGAAAEQSVKIEYAGDIDWKIASATCANSALDIELKETHRDKRRDGVGLVGYVVTVRLKPDASPGTIRDRIVLGINDAYNKSLDLAMAGSVQADVSISPANLSIGKIAPNANTTQKVLVRGVKPFKIVSINGGSGPFEIEKPDDAKPLHVLTLKLKPDQQTGEVSQQFEIATNIEGESPLKLTVSATLLKVSRTGNGSP